MSKLVLIVDDEDDWPMIIEEDLQRWGHSAITYHSSDEVLEAIRSDLRYDLAIVDLAAEEDGSNMVGLEVIAESKNINPDVPVIILSGWERGRRFIHGHLEFFDIGKADNYICKGYYVEQRRIIRDYLAK